ncbi:molecular chaperone DnaJ [Acetobacter nitrogenifigens DSM 23921 = NBRC 105050]|uniref:Molecular chaperone DnaJ n=1 Tax=Acetobacter nitrogenifigens DSM 23921 = NBRC 105050 TaxID=1120919 RepID=A0A511X6E1_9PROT|nr:DnaJ C-terminal domain-containing protein [Acetobacter nitrogenifigens]GBQ94423.1 molecular chaperone DnaJ [Acetobacter nitrogenifigens DSM 23921 = NBRC 105050]GEN58518.1 molecular chaperone DnaJ [Acetobacter nitrogenifigens DSM 23921 = NBRC 105050]
MSTVDPYEILGVARTASQDDIRKAYRALAKKYHPDLNPGDKAAEEKFKSISRANDLLSDENQRGRFDRGEIDGSGQERAPPGYGAHGGYRDFADGAGGFRYGGGGGGFSQEDLGDILGGMFGGGRSGFGRRPGGPERGADRSYSLTVPFVDAVLGATSRINLPGGAELDVRIPPGIEDGQVLRLRGKGAPGQQGGPDGDALITVTVTPDARYTREGRDLRQRLPVDLKTAVLGGPIMVPTPSGTVRMNVPEGSDTGSVMRLRGRGVKEHGGHEAGNLYVVLEIHVGKPDDALQAFLKDWKSEGGAVGGEAA